MATKKKPAKKTPDKKGYKRKSPATIVPSKRKDKKRGPGPGGGR